MSRRHLPNLLTICRAVLAFIFLIVLNNYRYTTGPNAALVGAFVLFILAAVTDWADGFLARRWDVVTSFGRIMDPVCDKVLVLGALIYLAGPRFVDPNVTASEAIFFGMLTPLPAEHRASLEVAFDTARTDGVRTGTFNLTLR